MTAETAKIQFAPSWPQHQFITSTALENLIEGPRGEGKTEAGIIGMAHHAMAQKVAGFPTPQPWAIVRDTFENLQKTTVRSIRNSILAPRLRIYDGGKKIVERSGLFEVDLFGMDDDKDLNKFQSLALAGINFEECAPALETDIGGGIQEEAWAMGLTSLRFPCAKPRAQIEQNPPDEEHWTQRRFKTEPVPDCAFFHIPRGSNAFLPTGYRELMAKALSNRPDLARRLVEGLPGFVQSGVPVAPGYSESKHRSTYQLAPLPRILTYRFWDGWHNPTVIICQRTPRGRVIITDCIRAENMGVRQMIKTFVKPILSSRYRDITEWEDYGDESMNTPDQSTREMSASKAVNEELSTVFRGVSNDWNPRREAVNNILSQMIDGEAMIAISRHEKILHQALRGGWHYPKTASGVVGGKPVKNQASHPGDAFSYLAVTLMPAPVEPLPTPSSERPRQTAKSYAVR